MLQGGGRWDGGWLGHSPGGTAGDWARGAAMRMWASRGRATRSGGEREPEARLRGELGDWASVKWLWGATTRLNCAPSLREVRKDLRDAAERADRESGPGRSLEEPTVDTLQTSWPRKGTTERSATRLRVIASCVTVIAEKTPRSHAHLEGILVGGLAAAAPLGAEGERAPLERDIVTRELPRVETGRQEPRLRWRSAERRGKRVRRNEELRRSFSFDSVRHWRRRSGRGGASRVVVLCGGQLVSGGAEGELRMVTPGNSDVTCARSPRCSATMHSQSANL